jgi:hypothetical protein
VVAAEVHEGDPRPGQHPDSLTATGGNPNESGKAAWAIERRDSVFERVLITERPA